MHWLTFLVVFCVFKKSASSWKGTPRGQVSCDSRLQCLLLAPAFKRMRETAPSREINTWYPIPKWKVFPDAKKNGSGYSSPYFNKQDPGRADGYIRDNDFSPVPDLKKRTEVFERLNIQFLPLKDGNLTVKGFRGKINVSEEEYVALFAVYAHSGNKEIPGARNNSDGETVTVKEMELMNMGRENASVDCHAPGGCSGNSSGVFSTLFNTTDSELYPTGEEVVTIPVTKNMSIEMKIGELDNDNYTVMIIPFNKIVNETVHVNGDSPTNDGEIINVLLTRNMSMFMRSGELVHSNETVQNVSRNGRFIEVNGSNEDSMGSFGNEAEISETGTHNSGIAIIESVTEVEIGDSNIPTADSDIASIESVTEDISTSSILGNSENRDNFSSDNIFEMPNNTVQNIFQTIKENLTDSTTSVIMDITDNLIDNNTLKTGNAALNGSEQEFDLNKTLSAIYENDQNNKLYEGISGTPQYELFQRMQPANITKKNRKEGYVVDSYQAVYSKKLGPYEIKELNSDHSPFIATIHLTINNKETNSATGGKDISLDEVNNYVSKGNLTTVLSRNMSGKLQPQLQRRKRRTGNENSTGWHKFYRSTYRRKQKNINNEFASLENEISNKYPNETPRMILNEIEERTPAVGSTNQAHNPLILSGGNAKERSNSSRLFLFLLGPDSYSYATISKSNEEFNQKSTDKFRNKGLIANEISDNAVGADGAKSNQTALGDRNKREVALPTLIPNKDSRENHSVPKKSELQIVEGGSLDKQPGDWKMKIPPEQHLRGDGIKRGKICDLEDGCRRINDVFNTVTDSEYYKNDGAEGRSFDSGEVTGARGGIDKGIKILNQNFMRKVSGKSIYTRNKRNEEVKGKFMYAPPNPRFYFRNINSFQKQLTQTTGIHDGKNNYLKMSSIQLKGMNNLKANKANDLNYERNLKSNDGKFEIETLRRYIPSEEYEISKFETPMKQSNLNVQSKIHVPTFNILRKKRTVPKMLPIRYPTNSFYSMNLNELPLQIYPHGIYPRVKNASLIPSENQMKIEENEWQNYIQRLLQISHMVQRTNPRNTDMFHVRPDTIFKEWIRRGTEGQQRRRQPKWLPSNSVNYNTFTQNTVPDYKWIIFVPDNYEPLSARGNRRRPTESPVNSNSEPKYTDINPEREREEDEWVLIDPVNEPGRRKNVNTAMPPSEQRPRDIINSPTETPSFRTTTQPRRKPVSPSTSRPITNFAPRTTTRPGRIPFTSTTRKPRRIPNFRTTSTPWSFDRPWDFSPWSISQNPWESHPTTPMMMGGMGGSD